MSALRRNLSRLLAVWAVRVDPDPPFTITTRPRWIDHVTDCEGFGEVYVYGPVSER